MIEMKKFYEKYVLPKIINCACGTKPILIQRQKIVPSASGVILEIGVGSGVNIPYYSNSNVKKLIGLDLQQDNWDQAYKIAKKTLREIYWEYEVKLLERSTGSAGKVNIQFCRHFYMFFEKTNTFRKITIFKHFIR